ncbi:MAG: radical SAM protein, partial [bacterium]
MGEKRLSQSMKEYATRRALNYALSSIDKLMPRSNPLARPLRFHLEINDLCNLKCIHCARENDTIPKRTGSMPIEAVRRMAPFFKSATWVGIAGNGEPFLHRNLLEILEIISENGATPSVITNAMLFNDKKIEKLFALKKLLLMISLDGGMPQTFERIRKGARWSKLIEALEMIREAKKHKPGPFPLVNFLCCLMRDNLHELEQMIELAHEYAVPAMLLQTLIPYAPEIPREQMLNYEETAAEIDRCRPLAQQYNIRLDFNPTNFTLQERREGEARHNGNGNANANGKRLFCPNIWQQFHVEVSGNVRFCCMWTKGSIGNVLEKSVDEIWRSRPFQELRAALLRGEMPEDCSNCHLVVDYDRSK